MHQELFYVLNVLANERNKAFAFMKHFFLHVWKDNRNMNRYKVYYNISLWEVLLKDKEWHGLHIWYYDGPLDKVMFDRM